LVREFEVAVICVETGQTFGSIRWGYTKTHDGVITLTGAQPSDVQASAATPQLETVRQAFYSGFFQHSLSDFALGSDALTADHRRTLQSIAAGGSNINRIVRAGANDFSGGPEANAALSLRRAQAVRNELVRLGINSSLIEVQGHGVAARVPNPPGQQVAANRRVDVHIERGTIPTSTGDVGSTAEGVRFVQQDPRLTFDELITLLLELQRLTGALPQDRCYQLGFMRDSLRRWRSIDPSVPDVDALYGALIRTLLGRCPPSSLPATPAHEPSGHRPESTGPPDASSGAS
jgi:outer membrane protein OmpA-like peptidoglycan-associated protein